VSERGYRLPGGLSPEEERAILAALERYLLHENPRPDPWVLAGRVDATGLGALQARRLMDAPWGSTTRTPFARRGAPPFHGRADCH
jgi:hypothetical protein